MPHANKADNNRYHRNYQLGRYYRRRREAIKKLGGQCIDCLTQENLEFDHKKPSDKLFAIAKIWSASEQRFQAEIEKCVLRCRSCHQKRHKDPKVNRKTHRLLSG